MPARKAERRQVVGGRGDIPEAAAGLAARRAADDGQRVAAEARQLCVKPPLLRRPRKVVVHHLRCGTRRT